MKIASLLLSLAALRLAAAATNSADVAALAGLQKCIAQHASALPYVMGWNLSSNATASVNSAPGAQEVLAGLAAMGVPGLGSPPPAADGAAKGSSDPCGTVPWTGLLCSGDRVTQVLISQLATTGNLPCDVGDLADLNGLSEVERIDFTNAGLTGQLPEDWSSGFDKLVSLTLAQNEIDGTLPASWSEGFPKLDTLRLEQNRIGGQLPPEWGFPSAFPSLLNLVLGDNDLSGELPAWEGGFQVAQLFGLSNNFLGGVLPDVWSFPALRVLELNDNDFQGCLPSAWQLPSLTSLDVHSNQLSGEIPVNYDNWGSLTRITITPGNDFCGTVSPQVAATPDRKGRRFQPEPSVTTSAGGFDLPSCNDVSCPAYAYAPGPAPDSADAPATATGAAAAPSLPVAAASIRRLFAA